MARRTGGCAKPAKVRTDQAGVGRPSAQNDEVAAVPGPGVIADLPLAEFGNLAARSQV